MRIGAFLHSSSHTMTEIELMQFLHQCGYWRATIETIDVLTQGLSRVIFVNVEVLQAPSSTMTRSLPIWPVFEHPFGDKHPFFTPNPLVVDDEYVLQFGLSLASIVEFFNSTQGVLCRDPDGYDFPDTTRSALRLSSSDELTEYDRLIIYTDGSSKALDHSSASPLE